MNNLNDLEQDLKKKVLIIADMPAPEGDDRYWINAYRGCGVYRLAIRDRMIVATVYEGFYDSTPLHVDPKVWKDAVIAYVKERCGEVVWVKADGSGTYFFLRDAQDAKLIKVKEYDVPSPCGIGNKGRYHHNIEIATKPNDQP